MSPDGGKIVTSLGGVSSDVWIYDIGREVMARLTLDGISRVPVWTTDGKRIVYSGTRRGAENLFWRAADGSGEEERLTSSPHAQYATAVSPDGAAVVYQEWHPETSSDIWVAPLAGERKPRPIVRTPYTEWWGAFSPNGRWLAYASNASGRDEVYVQAYPDPGARIQISAAGGTWPMWARGGNELYFRDGRKFLAAEVKLQPSFSAGKPRLLFEADYIHEGYDAGPGGTILSIERSSASIEPAQIQLVLNWFEELSRRKE